MHRRLFFLLLALLLPMAAKTASAQYAADPNADPSRQNASPVGVARDQDDTAIPEMRELIREGFGPEHSHYYEKTPDFVYRDGQVMACPIPTMAFYGDGYAVFYGFTSVPTRTPSLLYAFGYSAAFYRSLLPQDISNVNLDNCTVKVRTPAGHTYLKTGAQESRGRSPASAALAAGQ